MYLTDRRTDARFPSSIPAGINGRGDLRHVALVHNTSRSGALLGLLAVLRRRRSARS